MPYKKKPTILYHYTSFDVFRKIMEGKPPMMRATHYSEMNDLTELERGLELVTAIVEDYDFANAHSNTKKYLRSVVVAIEERKLPLYIFSLSADGDSLDQWRAYCPDGGVAIGFKFKGLAEHFKGITLDTKPDRGHHKHPWELSRCEYPTEKKPLSIDHLVSQIDNAYKTQDSLPTDNKMEHFLVASMRDATVYLQTLGLCCCAKHYAYRSEQEWRIYSMVAEDFRLDIQLDEKNRRYVEMPFVPSKAIKKVVVSPHGDTRQGRSLAHHFKDSMQLKYEIEVSDIPFRT